MQDEIPKIDEQAPAVEPIAEQSVEQVSDVPVETPTPIQEPTPEPISSPQPIPNPEPAIEPQPISDPEPMAETPAASVPDPVQEVIPKLTPPEVPSPPAVVSDVPKALTTEPEKPVITTPPDLPKPEPVVSTPPTTQPEPTKEQGGIPQKVLDLSPAELDAARRLWATRTIHDAQKASVQARKDRVAENTKRVEHFVKKYGPTTVRTVGLELGMSTRSVSSYLMELTKTGKINATGNTVSRRYS